MKIYVVLGESGEYSGRSVWVAGAYSTREAAEGAMTTRMAKRRAFEIWSDAALAHQRRLDKRGPFGWRFPISPEDNKEFDAMRAEAERLAGPKPEYEGAERVELFEMTLDEWQNGWAEEIASANSVSNR